MSSLRLISETEITSTINTLNIYDVFTDDFDIYLIQGKEITMTSNDYLHGRVINSNNLEETSNYSYASKYIPSSSSVAEERLASRTEWESFSFIGNGTNDSGEIAMYVFNPTNAASYTFYISQATSFRTSTPQIYHWKSIGSHESATSITGIQFSAKTGNMDGGKFRIYGLRVDS